MTDTTTRTVRVNQLRVGNMIPCGSQPATVVRVMPQPDGSTKIWADRLVDGKRDRQVCDFVKGAEIEIVNDLRSLPVKSPSHLRTDDLVGAIVETLWEVGEDLGIDPDDLLIQTRICDYETRHQNGTEKPLWEIVVGYPGHRAEIMRDDQFAILSAIAQTADRFAPL